MERRRIAISLGTSLAAEAANKLFPLVTLHLAASRLGVAGFGAAQFTMWLIDLAIVFVVFGYNNASALALRDAATARARAEVIGATVAARLAHAALGALVIVLAVSMRSEWLVYRPLMLPALFVILTSALDMLWALTALQLLPAYGLLSITAKTVSLALTWLLVRGDQDVLAYIQVTLGANALISLGSLMIITRRTGIAWPGWKAAASLARGAVPFAATWLLLMGLDRYDLLIAELFLGTAGAGAYAGPQKLALSLTPLVGTIATVFYSEVLGVRDREAILRHLHTGLRLALIAVVPLAMGVWFVDRELVAVILGGEYADHARIFSILCLVVMPQAFLLAMGNQALVALQNVRAFNLALGAGLAGGILISLWATRFHGLPGTAWATVAGRLIAAALTVLAARRTLGMSFRHEAGGWLAPLIPGGVMAVGLAVLPGWPLIAKLAVGAGIYGAGILLICRQEVRWLWNRLRRPAATAP